MSTPVSSEAWVSGTARSRGSEDIVNHRSLSSCQLFFLFVDLIPRQAAHLWFLQRPCLAPHIIMSA